MYQYSKRLSWNLPPNWLSRETSLRRERGETIIDLTNFNPTELFSNYPHVYIAGALGELNSFRYEPKPLGTDHARLAVSQYYGARDITISPERIILTASTSEAYALLFKLFCNPDDEILVPTPSYPLFEFLAHLESVRVENYRLHFDGSWYVDLDNLRQRITSFTRAIVVVNPNNPTGSSLTQRELEALADISISHRIPIICDEVFMDYMSQSGSGRVQTLIGRDDFFSFSLNGLSKAAGMPQMKLGWIAINGPDQQVKTARERLELIADTYLSVGTPVQNALPRLLKIGAGVRDAIARRIRTNLQTLDHILRDTAAHALRYEGGWSAVVRLPATQSEESWILRLLNEHGIVTQPGYFFDMASQPYIVVSLITTPEEFEKGIAAIRHVMASV